MAASPRAEIELAWAVVNLGDLDGDGLPEFALASETAPDDGVHGAINVMYLQPN